MGGTRYCARGVRFGCGVLLLVLSATITRGAQQQAQVNKIDPVAVVGCLQESKPNTWTLVDASEPVSSNPNAPSAKELATLPKGGKRVFQLIGVSVFDLPSHRGHTVVVKGLPLPAPPAERLNMTSVTTIAPTCAGRP